MTVMTVSVKRLNLVTPTGRCECLKKTSIESVC
jgi:hypothetical protein